MNQTYPQMRVLAFGDVLVFVEPKMFNTRGDRKAYGKVLEKDLSAKVCGFGFRKVRMDSEVAPETPNEEYDFRCPVETPTPQSTVLPPGMDWFAVRMAGNSPAQMLVNPSYANGHFDVGLSTKPVCWMHLAAGGVLYVVQDQESYSDRVNWHGCYAGRVGDQIPGRVRGNRLELFLWDGKKGHTKKYLILSMSDANTTQ